MARAAKRSLEAPIQISRLVVLQNGREIEPESQLISGNSYGFRVELRLLQEIQEIFSVRVAVVAMLYVAVTPPASFRTTQIDPHVIENSLKGAIGVGGGQSTSLYSDVIAINSTVSPTLTDVSLGDPWALEDRILHGVHKVAQLRATAYVVSSEGDVGKKESYVFPHSAQLAWKVRFLAR